MTHTEPSLMRSTPPPSPTTDVAADGLPRSAAGRLAVALLALPSFLICTTFLFAIPLVYVDEPPDGAAGVIVTLLMGELFGLGSSVTLLALVWAAATPGWVARLLECRSRFLVLLTGVFLLVAGGLCLTAPVVAGAHLAALLIAPALPLGAVFVARAPFVARGEAPA